MAKLMFRNMLLRINSPKLSFLEFKLKPVGQEWVWLTTMVDWEAIF